MNIRKLPSGSYQIREMIDGQRFSVTVPYKPKQSEAKRLIAERVTNAAASAGRLTVDTVYRKYIDGKSAVLSPASVRTFECKYRKLPDWLRKTYVADVDGETIQKYVNQLIKEGLTVTTSRSHIATLASAIRTQRPNFVFHASYPVEPQKDVVIPEDDQVKMILEAVKGTENEIMFMLCAFGLRRSEVCALSLEDLDGTDLYIHKSMVTDKDYNHVVKQTKTSASTRHITISQYLADRIREQGYICKCSPDALTVRFSRTVEKLGLPHMSIHKLRYYFCSKSHALGIPDAYTMYLGGWQTTSCMNRVYRHAQKQKTEEVNKVFIEALSNLSDSQKTEGN